MAKTISYLVHPHGVIEKVEVEVDGGIIWGPESDETGQIAWLTPTQMYQTENSGFLITSINNLSPVMLPGITLIEASLDTVSRVFQEQFQKRLHNAHNVDPLKGRMLFMIVGTILSLGLVGFLFLTQFQDGIKRVF